jgi:hypothetical protein
MVQTQSQPTVAASRRTSFVVRFWEEAREGDQPVFWRGSVTAVTSGETLLFDELTSLVRFMARHSQLEIA